jgi:hypothetical protein
LLSSSWITIFVCTLSLFPTPTTALPAAPFYPPPPPLALPQPLHERSAEVSNWTHLSPSAVDRFLKHTRATC